jgi:hypothetical protein
MKKSHFWDAHYVGIKAMREHQQNCITLDELAKEVLPLLYRFAPTITEDQIPQFTAWAASDLKGNMAYLKNSYLSKPFN